jgi:FKBP-type peptidyl-prolyl cis-trans isomerase FkpA
MRSGILPLVALFIACGDGPDAPPAKVGTVQGKGQDQALVEENKRLAQREALDIDGWITRQGLNMERTGTGVRIQLIEDSAGSNAEPLQTAAVRFRVSLIDGTTCYASPPDGTEDFLIEKDNVESGLHEAIQHLSVGDSAIIVIPSHRAYGLAGDSRKIPMRSTVIYHLRLVGLR